MNAIISFCTTLNKLMGLVGVFPQHCNAPLIVKMGVMTQEEADQKYQQMLVEMMQDDFNALWYYLTAWVRKPAS